MIRFALLSLAALASAAGPLVAQPPAAPGEARLLRFPAIHGNRIRVVVQ
jgi:hypothetical protein